MSWMGHFLLCFTIVLLFFPFSGCMKRVSSPWVVKIPPGPPPPGSDEIMKLPAGDKRSFQELSEDLRTVQVIFVGESHDQIEHHRIQLRIIKDLVACGKDIVIGMEMFQKSQQPVLDRWSQGFLAEEEFLREVQWETTWGMDYRLYKGILDEAKDSRIKVLGLNVPRELVRKVAQNGAADLSAEDREKLPEMDLGDREHRAYIESIYKGHEGGLARDFEKFYQAQVLWDEGMAENLSEFLSSPEGRGKTAVVLAGNGHIAHHFGIPGRFFRRMSIPYKTIVLKEWGKGVGDDPMFTESPLPLADYLWITHPTPPEKKRPRIGIVLREEEEPTGVWIERIIPKSPAEHAGLLPGDRILAVDDKEIKKLRDLHDSIVQKARGREIIMTILRGSSEKKVSITLPSPEN